MYIIKLLLLVLSFTVYFSTCERVTKIKWWFAKLKDDLRDDNAVQNANISELFQNSTSFDQRLSKSNPKGTFYITKEIDGVYRCAITSYLDPSEVLYKKYSEVNSKWITTQRWRFYREDADDYKMVSYENINLVFDGIDTIADLTIFTTVLEIKYNMFIKQILNIKKQFDIENKFVSLILATPVSQALHAYNKYAKTAKLNPGCPPSSYNGDCHVSMLRKMQSSFGSIIGPSVPSMGITGPVYFEAYNETTIRHILNNLEEQNGNWNLNVTVYFAENARKVINGSVDIEIVDQKTTEKIAVKENSDKEYVYRKTLIIPKNKVKLWWPSGYGNQDLYDLKVKFTSFKGEETSRTIRVGFRTVELVQEKLSHGTSFYFKVNGRPIFMKGTVLAPLSLQPELALDVKKIKNVLSLIIKHNMNMIRIWGGGLYQNDEFYDMADQMGLLIWQDFMFTDYSYPADKSFLSNVKEEMVYQVRRLYNHPSVVIFCGNDEGELSIVENRYNQAKYNNTKADYLTLFAKTMKNEFDKITFGKGIFITSTPSNGVSSSATEIAKDPNSPTAGDAHLFKYEEDPFKHDTYSPLPRFVSSYGIQSLPKIESFAKDTDAEKDWYIDSEFMESRQHWPDGNKKLKKMMEYQFVLPPPDDYDFVTATKFYIYYSQVIQAYGMRIQTEKYRSNRNSMNKDGSGNTMGALYWHFNDVWTAPSWSGIDYYGDWKMLQYYVPKFFAPHIITGQLSTNSSGTTSLKLFVVADATGLNNVEAKLKTGRWDELGTNSETSMTVSVDADSSKLIYTVDDIDDFLSKRTCSRKDCFFYLELEDNGKAIAPENFILPHPMKDSNIGHPNVQIHVKKLPYVQVYAVTLTTDKNALFVWLDAHVIDGYFSDNGFLLTTPSKKIYFYSSGETTEEKVQAKMTVAYIGFIPYVPPESREKSQN